MPIIGVPIILLGLWMFYMKYRSIVRGVRCKAKVVECPPTYGGNTYIVEFDYNGECLQRPLLLRSTLFPRRKIGKEMNVYYSARYPNFVSSIYLPSDVLVLAIIALGLFVAFNA